MKKKVTLDDIVKYTNFSKYTVSRALAGKPGISDATRNIVLKAAKDLGYCRTVSSGKGGILLFIPKSDLGDSTFWMNVVRGIEGEAAKNGYSVYIRTINPEEPLNAVTIPTDVQGIIYASHKCTEIMKLLQADIPAVLISIPPEPLLKIDTITVADYEGGYCICQELLNWGHQTFAFYGSAERPSHKERFRGMRSALMASNLDFKYLWPVTNIAENNSNIMYDILAGLIKKNEMPTAIICITDSLALSLLWTLNDLGISVPNMVSITGYDSDPNEVFNSPITSIGMDKIGIGINAFSLLLSRIENRDLLYKRICIVPQLIIRKTAGPVNPK